jgi:hypothetical protein
MVWTRKTIAWIVQTIVGLTQTLFSEMEPIFYASETSFSITQKTIGQSSGGDPASQSDFPEGIRILLDSREGGDYLTLPTKRSSNRQFS